MTFAKITAVAKAVPDFAVTNDDLSQRVDTNDEWIFSRSGIKERRIMTEGNTSDLCAEAFNNLMKKSGTDPLDIDVLIVATTTPDYLTPTTSCLVQSKTGAKNAFCFDIGAGCSGLVYGISVADKFLKCGKYKNAVVIGADLLSKITDWTDRSTCVLFGDGAGAVLLTASDEYGIICEDIRTDGERVNAIVGNHLPANNVFRETITPNPNYVVMDGRAVFDFAIREVPKSILRVLEESGVTLSEIDYIIPHQANYRIVEGVAKKMKLGMDKFFTNMDKYGNTSAASIGIALTEMEQRGLIKFGSGRKLVLTGFGSGLTWGTILVQI